MRFLLAGGGTLGPVTPLLAVVEELRRVAPESEFLFVGTPGGPERRIVEAAGLAFEALDAPKFRRYADVRTLALPFAFAKSVFAARKILKRFKPDAVVGAGGYVQVPLGYAAASMRVKLLIHQQDVVPSLSNKLLASFADAITVTFDVSLKDFPGTKTSLVGNPVRTAIEAGDRAEGLKRLGFTGERPVALVLGGGTGSAFLNELVALGSPHWTGFADLAHVTGLEKAPVRLPPLEHPDRYRQLEFVGVEIAHLMAAADVVVSRAGMGSLTELAALAKPVILVPIAGSHQERNAEYVVERGGARMFRELDLTPEHLVTFAREIVKRPEEGRRLGLALQGLFRPGARAAIADKLLGLVRKA